MYMTISKKLANARGIVAYVLRRYERKMFQTHGIYQGYSCELSEHYKSEASFRPMAFARGIVAKEDVNE